jgi:membrane protein
MTRLETENATSPRPNGSLLKALRRGWRIVLAVYERLNAHDAWAIASHIALSALLALFPFLIFLTALASFLGTQDLADSMVKLLFDALPAPVARPLAQEVTAVLTGQRRDLLTLGGALALWFSSSGVEALRIGLNRAYGVLDERSWFRTRIQSVIFVLVGAIGLLALSFLVVLAPAVIHALGSYFPELEAVVARYDLTRFAATGAILLIGLTMAHRWLPAGHREISAILPGILLTLIAWLLSAAIFGLYLARFSTYASTYAGFAGAMIALVFLYVLSLMFLIGGELNAAIEADNALR